MLRTTQPAFFLHGQRAFGKFQRYSHHPDGLAEYSSMSKKWLCRDTERWWLLDCKGQQLPHIASIAAHYATGQARGDFRPGMLQGDQVVLINCKDVVLTGDQWLRNPIEWQTTWPGGKYRVRMSEMFNRDPCMVVWNQCRQQVEYHHRKTRHEPIRKAPLENLWLYEGATHPHNDKSIRPLSWNPSPISPRYKGAKQQRWTPNAFMQ